MQKVVIDLFEFEYNIGARFVHRFARDKRGTELFGLLGLLDLTAEKVLLPFAFGQCWEGIKESQYQKG